MQYRHGIVVKLANCHCSDEDRFLPPTRQNIDEMKRSLQAHGQIHPICVHPVARNTYRVFAGATRFRAASELGMTEIRAEVFLGSASEFKLYELVENLGRRELTKEQRAEMKRRIKELQRERLKNVEPAKGGRGHKGGRSEAAREAGVSRRTVRRRQDDKGGQNTKSAQVSGNGEPYKISVILAPDMHAKILQIQDDQKGAYGPIVVNLARERLVLASAYERLDRWAAAQRLSPGEALNRLLDQALAEKQNAA